MTLYECVMGWRLHDQQKHDLGDGHAVDRFNLLTNEELLREISDALEHLVSEGEK